MNPMYERVRRAAALLALTLATVASVATSEGGPITAEQSFLVADDAISAPFLVPAEGIELAAVISFQAPAPAALEARFSVEVQAIDAQGAEVEVEVVRGTTAEEAETLVAVGPLEGGLFLEDTFLPPCASDPDGTCAHDEPILVRVRRTDRLADVSSDALATVRVFASFSPTERPAGPEDRVEVTLHAITNEPPAGS